MISSLHSHILRTPSPVGLLLALCLLAPALVQAAPKPAANPAAAYPAAAQALGATPARPQTALLHPAGARVQVREDLTPLALPGGVTGVRLVLPAQADPASLVLVLPGNGVATLSHKNIPAADAPDVARRKAELSAARRDAATVTGSIAASEARIALWSKPPAQATVATEVDRLDTLMARKLEDLHAALPGLRERETRLMERVQRLEAELAATGGQTEEAIEVTAQLVRPATGPLQATYTYDIANCGWKAAYRLEALPDSNEVRFTYQAEVWQGSGTDWTGVDLTIATAAPGSVLQPPHIGPWEVRPRPEAPMGRAKAMMETAPAPMMAAAPAPMPRMAQPDPVDNATFTSWSLGQRSLPAGAPVHIALAEESWQAAFTYTVRPTREERAFLAARVTLPAPRDYPEGNALFLADGAAVGAGTFALAGDKTTLFFGSDPRVKAKMQLDTRKSGKTGIVDRNQTRVWAWTIEVTNGRNKPVTVRVEDAEPQSRDTGITVERTSTPQPVVEDHQLIWELPLPAAGRTTIQHSVKVTAPAAMKLDEGRL